MSLVKESDGSALGSQHLLHKHLDKRDKRGGEEENRGFTAEHSEVSVTPPSALLLLEPSARSPEQNPSRTPSGPDQNHNAVAVCGGLQ